MVIDTSAVIAWLKKEPERGRIVTALESHAICRISSISLLEAQIVIRARENPALLTMLNLFLQEINAVIMPFDESQARLAFEAYQRYGKGQGHPAQLNLGDCAVYALAKSVAEPLLFVGNDFNQTDLEVC